MHLIRSKIIISIYIALMIVISSSCNASDKTPEALIIKCIYINQQFQRCENAEVICYKYIQNSIQCHFKKYKAVKKHQPMVQYI